jgi:polyisoprenoid-binding protein YceI
VPLRFTTAAAFAVCLLVGAAVAGQAWPATGETVARHRIDPARSRLSFFATSRFVDAPGLFHRFRGEIRVDREAPERSAVVVEVEAASIDTRNARRDDHLRSEDFFWVERFPLVRFQSDRVERAGDGFTVAGSLTMRGVTRALAVPLAVSKQGQVLTVRGQFVVRQSDFGFPYRGLLNPIRDDVQITFELVAVPIP